MVPFCTVVKCRRHLSHYCQFSETVAHRMTNQKATTARRVDASSFYRVNRNTLNTPTANVRAVSSWSLSHFARQANALKRAILAGHSRNCFHSPNRAVDHVVKQVLRFQSLHYYPTACRQNNDPLDTYRGAQIQATPHPGPY